MNPNQPARLVMIGCGGMARGHVRDILQQQGTAQIVVVCDPSPEAYALMSEVFTAAGLSTPPNQPDLTQLLNDYRESLDVAFVVTPHAYHYEQARACLEAGLDVLLEKPMVVTAEEAKSLIDVRDKTGKLLVIAFNGSLSPRIRAASQLLRVGELGSILNVVAFVWEDWSDHYKGHWKQDAKISGGGFMFDTGAHMLNTVADLVGEDFVEVAAWLDNRDRTVDILGCVMGRLRSGALVTIECLWKRDPVVFVRNSPVLHQRDYSRRRLGQVPGDSAIRRNAASTPQRAAFDGSVGAVRRGSQRQNRQSFAAGNWAAHGASMGCDPFFSGTERRCGSPVKRSHK